MQITSSLTTSTCVLFVATTKPIEAIRFYTLVLGFKPIDDTPFATVFQVGKNKLRVQKVEKFTPQPFTVLGWEVRNLVNTVEELTKRGVVFERFPGIKQDAAGIWATPDGAKVAWFRDPDGNILSVNQPK